VLPERCVELCSRADLLLHCGDVCALAVWTSLERLGPPLAGVHGNTDELDLVELLPAERVVEVDGVRIGLVHDPGPLAGRSARLRERFPGCDAVIYGHTHIPEISRDEDVWILNPGSPTERRRAPAHSMLLIEVAAGEIRPRLVEL
jgi:putative phosphoesterase